MRWTDVQEIGEALSDRDLKVDPRYIRFTDLRRWVLELPGFNDDPEGCNERILEAIQAVWLAESD